MMRRMCQTVAWGILILMAGPVFGQVTNGDFSAGLTGWSTSGPVSDGGGFALLTEDPTFWQTSLTQQIVVPPETLSLSFEYELLSTPDGTSGYPVPDWFTASLLDPSTNAPILNTSGVTDYFYQARGGYPDFDPSIVSLLGNRVTLDLSSVAAGTDALLAFDLWGGDDGFATSVAIDNVEFTVVPLPGAVLLGTVGLALADYLRRRDRKAT